MKITTQVEVTAEQVTNLLTNALEGGSTYWARDLAEVKDYAGQTWASEAPMAGGWFDLIHDDPDSDDSKTTRIDEDGCRRGMAVMADLFPCHFANVLNGNDDAETADVFLQCIVFGDIIFG